MKNIICQVPYYTIISPYLGLDAALRAEELEGSDNRVTVGNSMINEKPILQFFLAQMMGKNPRKNSDGSYTFDEQWTTENVLRLSQIYIEPILQVRIYFSDGIFKNLIWVNTIEENKF